MTNDFGMVVEQNRFDGHNIVFIFNQLASISTVKELYVSDDMRMMIAKIDSKYGDDFENIMTVTLHSTNDTMMYKLQIGEYDIEEYDINVYYLASTLASNISFYYKNIAHI